MIELKTLRRSLRLFFVFVSTEGGLHSFASLLNSTMLSDFVRNADDGITLYIQHDSPGKGKEANWLPAAKGPFMATMRLYWPKPEALDGSWK